MCSNPFLVCSTLSSQQCKKSNRANVDAFLEDCMDQKLSDLQTLLCEATELYIKKASEQYKHPSRDSSLSLSA